MTNGDIIRASSNAQLALCLMCPVDACLTYDYEKITIKKESGCCANATSSDCAKCIYKWLQEEEQEDEYEL